MQSPELPKVFDSVVHMLADAAAISPDKPSIRDGERHLSYREYERCIAGFAHELVAMGSRGERVALICGNSLEMAVATIAAYAAEAQAVPVNPIYTHRELDHILRDSDPTIVLYDETSATTVEPLITALGIKHAVKIGSPDGKLLDIWRKDAIKLPPLPAPDDLAVLQYTGGTTGLPKGVNITHGQLCVNLSQREDAIPTLPEEERFLCVMPLFHVFATAMCLHAAIYCRGLMIILRRYHPEAVLACIERERITLLPAGPTIFNGLMSFEGFDDTDFSSVRIGVSGSAPLAEETLKVWEERTGFRILEGYGQTEAGPVLTYIRADEPLRPGSVGKPVYGTELQIVDVETGNEVLGINQQGEIRARGTQIMSGYRNRPDETAETLRDGWLYTGDIGEIDDQGDLYIRDRKKDMAIVGGYNVYPREIDEVLYAHPSIVEAAAVGVADEYRGEIINAFVVLAGGAAETSDDLIAYCREHLAKYKVPSEIFIVSEIAKTTVGKVDKTALREQAG